MSVPKRMDCPRGAMPRVVTQAKGRSDRDSDVEVFEGTAFAFDLFNDSGEFIGRNVDREYALVLRGTRHWSRAASRRAEPDRYSGFLYRLWEHFRILNLSWALADRPRDSGQARPVKARVVTLHRCFAQPLGTCAFESNA